ncbi:unnamed protein product [Peniophora sp. CBMAI 1063]|nr:unnamed protein product [Peniophora sp. CBMAI 1063]
MLPFSTSTEGHPQGVDIMLMHEYHDLISPPILPHYRPSSPHSGNSFSKVLLYHLVFIIDFLGLHLALIQLFPSIGPIVPQGIIWILANRPAMTEAPRLVLISIGWWRSCGWARRG